MVLIGGPMSRAGFQRRGRRRGLAVGMAAGAAMGRRSRGNDSQAAVQETQSEDSSTDELEKLAKLHDQGVLTDEEFAAKKKQVLGL